MDLWKFKTYTIKITIQNGEVNIVNDVYNGVSARAFDKSIGFASSNRLSDERLVIEKAKKLSKIKTGNEDYRFKHKPVEKYNNSKKEFPEYDIENIVNELKKLDKLFTPKLESRSLKLIINHTIRNYESNDSSITHDDIWGYFSSYGVARSGSVMESWSERKGWLGYGDIDISSFSGLVEKTGSKAVGLLSAEHAKKGKYTVVLDPDMTGVFTHEAVGHACEADAVINKSSVLNRLGEKVGNGLIKITDYSSYPDGFGNIMFDDEGVRSVPVVLINHGTLKNYMHNTYTAGMMNFNLTGNARMEDYDSPPIIRMRNTILEPANVKDTYSDDDIISNISKGIFLHGMNGGSVDPLTGSFMFGAKEAYMIEKGELKTHLRDVTMIGNIKETLHNIAAVGRHVNIGPGFCGKDGQLVRVSDGGPMIRVDDVIIG